MTEYLNIRRILVIKLRHIGDVLLTVPVFRALRERFPDAEISALVNAGTEAMLSGNPLVDEVIVFDRKIKKKSFLARIAREQAFIGSIRKRRFDMVVDLTSGDRPALLSLLSGARYRLAYDPGSKGFPGKRRIYTNLARRNHDTHTVLQNLDLLRQCGITTADTSVTFPLSDDEMASTRRLFAESGIAPKDRVVHVHPTSRWLFKCWESASVAEIIAWLLDRQIKVVLTSSPERKELKVIDEVLGCLGEWAHHKGLINLAGRTSLRELGAIAKLATVFFGVDSAPMHIAAAVGTPVVALFGPTGEIHWRPWGEQHVVVSAHLPCKPCRKGSCEGDSIRECLRAIAIDDVKVSIESVLERTRGV